jgi:hypothetical protein
MPEWRCNRCRLPHCSATAAETMGAGNGRLSHLRVMAVLVTAIHVLAKKQDADAPDKPAHDALIGRAAVRSGSSGRRG